MEEEEDIFTQLEVSPSTPFEDLKQAYKRELLKVHPDKSKKDDNDKVKFTFTFC